MGYVFAWFFLAIVAIMPACFFHIERKMPAKEAIAMVVFWPLVLLFVVLFIAPRGLIGALKRLA